METFKASFTTIILRYYLLMIVVIAPFYLGVPVLALIGLPIFLLAITGTTIRKTTKKKESDEVRGKAPNKFTNTDIVRGGKKLAY